MKVSGAVAKLANAAVCKTAIHRFESDPRLHSTIHSFLIAIVVRWIDSPLF
jgi:hypothetical protein